MLSAIKTQRLEMIPFSEAFLSEKYVSWLNDPEVVKYSEQRHRKHTMESCRQYLASFENSPNLFYAITLQEELEHIGNINVNINKSNQTADIGIIIGEKSFWGKGYASEAWTAMIQFLFANMQVRKVTGGTMSVNIGMIKAMVNSGMHIEGVLKRQFLLDGEEVDLVKAAIFKEPVR